MSRLRFAGDRNRSRSEPSSATSCARSALPTPPFARSNVPDTPHELLRERLQSRVVDDAGYFDQAHLTPQ